MLYVIIISILYVTQLYIALRIFLKLNKISKKHLLFAFVPFTYLYYNLFLINQRNSKHRPTGYWEVYHDNYSLLLKGNYLDGKRTGYWEVYHSNGNKFIESNYIEGKRIGLWKSFDYDGTLIRQQYFCE